MEYKNVIEVRSGLYAEYNDNDGGFFTRPVVGAALSQSGAHKALVMDFDGYVDFFDNHYNFVQIIDKK